MLCKLVGAPCPNGRLSETPESEMRSSRLVGCRPLALLISAGASSSRMAMTTVLVLGLGLTACSASDPPAPSDGSRLARFEPGASGFSGTLLDPPLRRPDVVLRDTSGDRFDLDRRPPDEVTALFFGFTNCDDICPTTMADLAAARRALPTALRERFLVAFVTVDPRRDSPRRVRQWLDRYDQDFVGLMGGNRHSRRAERYLYAPVSHIERAPNSHPEHGTSKGRTPDYEVEHSGTVYIFGPDEQSLIYTGGTTPQQYADDLTRLLRAS